MKTSLKFRSALVALFLVTMSVMATTSNAALNAYLKLTNTRTGATFSCSPDATGKFSFSNVPAGTYQLSIVCDQDYYTARKGEGHQSTIEISSWSWGASNPGARTTGDPVHGVDIKIGATRCTISDFRPQGNEYSKVVFQDLIISSLSSPSGTIQGMAINEKGLPGEKKPAKSNK